MNLKKFRRFLNKTAIENKFYSIFDNFYFGIKTYITRPPIGNERNTIVYICEANVPRLGRLLKYLSKIREEKMIVFVHKNKFFNIFNQDNTSISFVPYRSRTHLKFLIKRTANIKLIHGVESRSVFPSVGAQMSNNIPFIFDYQDLYINYFGKNPSIKWLRNNLPYERICLEKAHHIIAYSLEYNPAQKTYNLPRKSNTYFPFYLDDEVIIFNEKKELDKKIHLVYVGGISSCQSNDSFNLSLLKQQLTESNIYLHIYPSPVVSKDIIMEYHALSQVYPNYILHEPVTQAKLSAEISQYDFGFIPFYKIEGFLSDTKFKYSTTLKLFNYLEAGIPTVLMNYTIYQAWLVNHYHVGISLEYSDFKNLEEKIRSRNYNNLKYNVKLFQMKNRLSDHIHKISEIYDN